jgi:ribosome recycling factor
MNYRRGTLLGRAEIGESMKAKLEITGMEKYIEAVQNVQQACKSLRRNCEELERVFQEEYSVKMPPSEDGSEETRRLY